MSTYIPSIPTGTVPLKQDYLNLQNNFQQLDTTYGVDHYKFSDATANNGYHNTVTTPIIAPIPPNPSEPPTPPVDHPQFYAFRDSANIGVLQYSRQSKNAANQDVAPSPVTLFQSEVGAVTINNGSPLDVLDFTGLTRAMGKIIAADFGNLSTNYLDFDFWWNGSTLLVIEVVRAGGGINASAAGSKLRLTNIQVPPLTQVFWTIQFYRLS